MKHAYTWLVPMNDTMKDMVGSNKGHGADDINMMWRYGGHMAGKFNILIGHKWLKLADPCHHSQFET